MSFTIFDLYCASKFPLYDLLLGRTVVTDSCFRSKLAVEFLHSSVLRVFRLPKLIVVPEEKKIRQYSVNLKRGGIVKKCGNVKTN